MKNLFIAFEGIDGSGKSTQVKLLAENLSKAGHKVYSTFEPTDQPIGAMIRSIFSKKMTADERTIAALFAADRLEHLLNAHYGMLQKLAEGYTVITDRYYLSSYAYHGVHVPMDWVITLNEPCAALKRPDLTCFLDISPEVSMQRIVKSRENIELYETLENQKNVHNKYFEAMALVKAQENFVHFDATQQPDLLAQEIWVKVKELIRPI